MLKIIAKNSSIWLENMGDNISDIQIFYKYISFETKLLSELRNIKYNGIVSNGGIVKLPFETRNYYSYIVQYKLLKNTKKYTISANYMGSSEIMNIGDKYLEFPSPIT